MINPGEIPQIPGDMEALAGHASAISKVGGDFAGTGQRVNATWQGLAGVYRAPEAGQLFAATGPVQSVSATVGADIEAVGAALSTYAAEVAEIKRQLASLQSQAASFVNSVAGDDEWREDEGKVNQHNGLINSVNAQVAAFFEAQRKCANTINALYGGIQYRAENGDGRVEDGEYGFTADVLNAAAGEGVLPWGSSEKHDRGFLGDVGAYFGSIGDSFMTMLGDLGSLIGRDPVTGQWSWSTAGTAWTGVGKFAYAAAIYSNPITAGIDQSVGMPGFDKQGAGSLLLDAGKSMIAYDQWGEDNARAAGTATFNIVSAVVGTKGAGASLRGAGTAANVARTATAAKVSAGLIRAGNFIDNLPSATQIATRISDKFNIQIPKFEFGPIPAFADGMPSGGHRFDVETPGPRGPETFKMDATDFTSGNAQPGGDGLTGNATGGRQAIGHESGAHNVTGSSSDGSDTGGNPTRGNNAPLNAQERQRFTDAAQALGGQAEQSASKLLERQDIPSSLSNQAVRDFLDLRDSDRLAGTSNDHDVIMRKILERLAGPESDVRGVAAELRAFQDVVHREELEAGGKVAFGAGRGQVVDLGNGHSVATGAVPDADLLFRTRDGVFHLDEVKDSAAAEAGKLKDGRQSDRMIEWRDSAKPGEREIGVRIRTDAGWTKLFTMVRIEDERTYAIERLIRGNVPVKIGNYELSPAQLAALRDATERAFRDPKNNVSGNAGDWYAKHVPNLAAAREFLRPYGVDFL